jgi:hypothetical protein
VSAADDMVQVDERDVRIAVPLWGIGAVLAAWGLLRGKPLLFLVGAGAFFADHEAEPVRRVRELVGLDPS